MCVRGKPLPQGDVRVGGHSEGLLQLRQLGSAEDGPLPFPLALHRRTWPRGSVRLRGGRRTLTPRALKLMHRAKSETGLQVDLNNSIKSFILSSIV